ncbi:MAG: hypothetical protein QG632_64 [Candidatus Dependentiae bacterium]|nr:hypothetical protein [Candidatus Dependentiae bacterium]
MKYIMLYFFLFAASIIPTQATPDTPTAIPFGRLLLMLHETGSLESENPSKKEVGAVTLRAATALTQQAGIIILSPAIWQNLLFRKHWFATELTKPGSLASLLLKNWQAYREIPTQQGLTQINALLKSDPTLMYHFYLWQQELTSEYWQCWYHPDASLIILIPTAYLDEHAGLLPRPSITLGDAETVKTDVLMQATGLQLSKCKPIVLTESVEGLTTLLSQAKHLYKRSSFSLKHFESLFAPKAKTQTLLCRHWNIYMTGHGTHQGSICGLPSDQFIQFLSWCSDNLYINCFYYQSCYSGGQNLFDLYHARATSNQVAHQGLNLHFPLVVGALGDAPVHILMPYKELNQSSTIKIAIDINLNTFFTALEQYEESWPAILQPITPTITTASDTHALSNTPLLLLPGQTTPTPIDVNTQPNTSLNPHATRAGISVFSPQDDLYGQRTGTAFIVHGERALLLAPPYIRTPIEMYPYQKLHRSAEAHHSSFVSPAIISLIPGNALHHLTALTLHDLGLKDFITHSFIQMSKQKSTKVLLIDQLTINNDLAQHFTAPLPSWWENITSTVSRWFSLRTTPLETPRITLQNVLIIIGIHKITCLFREPHQDGSMQAYKATYQRPLKMMDALPDALPLTKVSLNAHARLYTKYGSFAASYRDSLAQNSYTAPHESTKNPSS